MAKEFLTLQFAKFFDGAGNGLFMIFLYSEEAEWVEPSFLFLFIFYPI